MSLAESFITPVSAAGLPKNFCHNKALGDESIHGLSTRELAKAFWTLEALTIDYAFTVNGVRTERRYRLDTDLEPIDRIGGGPLFAYQEHHSDRDVLAYLDLRDPREAPDGSFSLDFEVLEADFAPTFMFTLNPEIPLPELRCVHAYPFPFIGNTFYSQLYLVGHHQSGHIDHFSIQPEWFVFEHA